MLPTNIGQCGAVLRCVSEAVVKNFCHFSLVDCFTRGLVDCFLPKQFKSYQSEDDDADPEELGAGEFFVVEEVSYDD